MSSTPPETSPVNNSAEVSGRLKVEGERKSGVYGPYWNVTIKPENGPPIQATLSEKIWQKAGLIEPPNAGTDVLAIARLNPNGRWNVISIDVGVKELNAIAATFIGLHKVEPEPAADDEATCDSTEFAFYRVQLRCEGSPSWATRIPPAALQKFGIRAMPLNFTLISDWTRQRWGWKLERISDESLLGFYRKVEGELREATGHFSSAWKFDEDAEYVNVEMKTDVAELSLNCRLKTDLLRNAGVRAVAELDPVKALVSLRDGRWRLAELIEPRPDIRAHGGRELFYGVQTRFAYQEENRFGELEDWLEVQDDRIEIGVTSLSHAKLIEINEGALSPGARIVCDLRRGKNRWYASCVHRIAD
jgi:hypothetical protein